MTEHEPASKDQVETKPHNNAEKTNVIHLEASRQRGHAEPNRRGPETMLGGEHKMPHAWPEHHAHMAADFQKRFWISLGLTLPILLLSPMLQTLVGIRESV